MILVPCVTHMNVKIYSLSPVSVTMFHNFYQERGQAGGLHQLVLDVCMVQVDFVDACVAAQLTS
jgi:hypothetical protein